MHVFPVLAPTGTDPRPQLNLCCMQCDFICDRSLPYGCNQDGSCKQNKCARGYVWTGAIGGCKQCQPGKIYDCQACDPTRLDVCTKCPDFMHLKGGNCVRVSGCFTSGSIQWLLPSLHAWRACLDCSGVAGLREDPCSWGIHSSAQHSTAQHSTAQHRVAVCHAD